MNCTLVSKNFYTKFLFGHIQAHIQKIGGVSWSCLGSEIWPRTIDSLIIRTQGCIAELKDWMTINKVQLNDEIMFASSPNISNHPDLPKSISVNNTLVAVSPLDPCLGVFLDNSLTFEKHIYNICKTAYLELRRISSVGHLLSTDPTKTLVSALILSRIDYSYSLLAGAPKILTNELQRVQNNAARVICKSSKYDHISPLLNSLHWLPVSYRTDYKVTSITYSTIFDPGPSYLREILEIYTPTRQLRSGSDERTLVIPRIRLTSFGGRSFSYKAATT